MSNEVSHRFNEAMASPEGTMLLEIAREAVVDYCKRAGDLKVKPEVAMLILADMVVSGLGNVVERANQKEVSDLMEAIIDFSINTKPSSSRMVH